MKKRLFAIVMLVFFVVSLTSCSTSGKYVNTDDKITDSYINVYAGSNEKKGSGYARRMYYKSGNEWLTVDFWYDNGNVTVRKAGRKYRLNTAGFTVNKSKKQITYSGYTYQKKQ